MLTNRILYWDSCVFLSYINGEPAERLEDIDPLLDQAQRGEFELLTSTASIVEVAFGKVEQDNQALDPAIEERIKTLWQGPVKLVEFYALIADDARELMRNALDRNEGGDSWSLKPMDAVHLATARRVSVDEFHTYDSRLPKFASMVGIPIMEPRAAQRQIPGTRA